MNNLLIEKIKLYAYIGKLSLKKQNRVKEVVNLEYEQNIWNKKYDEKLFGEFFIMAGRDPNEIMLTFVNDKLTKLKYSEIIPRYSKQIIKILSDYKDNEFIELGCGVGNILFTLEKYGFKKLKGYDISTNAIKLANTHSVKINSNVKFGVMDLIQSMPDFTDKVLYTHTCMEQLKHPMKQVITNIIKSNPKLVVNFEVDYDSSPYLVKKYIDSRDYQNNLVRELKENPKIEIVSILRLPISMSSVNRLSCIVWKPKMMSKTHVIE